MLAVGSCHHVQIQLLCKRAFMTLPLLASLHACLHQVLFGAPSTEKQPGCLSVFVVEPSGPFTLAPEEGAGLMLRFTPRDARWVRWSTESGGMTPGAAPSEGEGAACERGLPCCMPATHSRSL